MYTALYRKKRPTSFAAVVEQSHIVTTLTNQLRRGQISHAYLFCGTRGTGKTTTAKIFARAVNCPSSVETGEPCNDCDTCKDILADRNLNVIEIDAASNNGVDNIRDLREEVKYPPSQGAYKVYIIDEVHMLTTAAFNALLKTLEEPPDHVIFILATTDPQKIPATILSRCQRYDFKRITRQGMVSALHKIMESDNHPVETDALEYIASVSDGAMRDALSILDQCLALGGELTLAKVQDLLGAVDQQSLFDYTAALIANNTDDALQIITQASKEGRDLSRFLADIIRHLRNILVAAQISDKSDILDYAPETIARFREQGGLISPIALIDYIKDFSELQNQLRYSSQERLMLEVYTVKLTNETSRASHEFSSQPQVATVAVPAPASQEATMPRVQSSISPAPAPITTATTSTATAPAPSDKWSAFCSSQSGLLKSMLSLCKAEGEPESGLTISCPDPGSLSYMKDHKPQIVSAITKYFNLDQEPNIVFVSSEGYNGEMELDNFKEDIQSQINMPINFE